MKKFALLFLITITTSFFAQENAIQKIKNFARVQTKEGGKVTSEGISKLFKTEATGDITIGSATEFVGANSNYTKYTCIAVLDETHFIVAYRDPGQSLAYVKTGVVSGTTITYPQKRTAINTNDITDLAIATLDDSHFVVVYQSASDSYAYIRKGTVSSNVTTFSGTALVDNSSTTKSALSVALLNTASDRNALVVSYAEGTSGKAVICSYNGSTLSFGTPNTFYGGIGSYTSVAAFSSSHFVISFINSSGDPKTIIGDRGTGTGITFGSYSTAGSDVCSAGKVITLNSTKFVNSYLTTSGNSPAYTVKTKVYEISGTSIASFGTQSSIATAYHYSISKITEEKFVLLIAENTIYAEGKTRLYNIDASKDVSSGGSWQSIYDQSLAYECDIASLNNSSEDAKFVIGYSNQSSSNRYGNSRVGTIEGTSLPIELTIFTAEEIDKNILLNWKTATEVNNYGFQVERRNEQSNWKNIAFIAGHGNSNSPKSYSFVDNSYLNGQVHYRLKQIDINGGYEYFPSKTGIEIKIKMSPVLKVEQNYPNPFNPSTTINFTIPDINGELTNAKLTIFNELGQEVTTLINKQLSAGSYSVTFNSDNIPSGIYFYKLTSSNNKTTNFSKIKKMILLK